MPFVDVSARGLYGGFFIGKSFDTFVPDGPAIVTADEVTDPQHLQLELDVNGEKRQRFGTDDMANTTAALIEHASSITTLRPGDMVATGTNHQGLGALQDGDKVVATDRGLACARVLGEGPREAVLAARGRRGDGRAGPDASLTAGQP